jgi:hypothetical protein
MSKSGAKKFEKSRSRNREQHAFILMKTLPVRFMRGMPLRYARHP